MLYGRCTPIEFDEDAGWFKLKCGKQIITINANHKIQVLLDAFEDSPNHSAYLREITFRDLIENTDLEEVVFTDDLMYLYGIGIE